MTDHHETLVVYLAARFSLIQDEVAKVLKNLKHWRMDSVFERSCNTLDLIDRDDALEKYCKLRTQFRTLWNILKSTGPTESEMESDEDLDDFEWNYLPPLVIFSRAGHTRSLDNINRLIEKLESSNKDLNERENTYRKSRINTLSLEARYMVEEATAFTRLARLGYRNLDSEDSLLVVPTKLPTAMADSDDSDDEEDW